MITPLKNYFSDCETSLMPFWYVLSKYRFKNWRENNIKKYQKKRIDKIVKFALSNSNFYKNYYKDFDIKNFSQLPTVNKKIIIDNLTEVNTINFTKEEIFNFCLEVEKSRDFSRRYQGINLGMSSGTSGNKGIEITTPREEKYLKTYLLARFPFLPNEKMNLAFILRVFTPAFNFNKFGHKLTYVDQMQPIDKIIKQLTKINPNIVSGPASMLKLLAKKIKSGDLNIKPKRLISYAEVLFEEDKDFIAEAFQAEVHQIYKATEASIAMTCQEGSLHINEDLVYVELLGEGGSPVPNGQPCKKMLVTDLHKTSMPIIRYALNDIITISPNKCACGSYFRVIQQIQGRGDDMLWARSIKHEGYNYIFPDFIRRAIISVSDKIEEYQVIQQSTDKLLLRVEPTLSKDDENSLIESIQAVFHNFECSPPHVIIKYEMPQANIRSGKLIRIHRDFPEPI